MINSCAVSEVSEREPQISSDRILYHLSKSPLLLKYLHNLVIEGTLMAWIKSAEFASIKDLLPPNPKNRQADLLQLYKETEWSHLLNTCFLEQKSQLDRVLFSAIQVRDLHHAEDLYCQLQDQSRSFTKLAQIYSQSPAATRGGSIGPVVTCQLHPLIQQHLIGLKSKQLSPIFKLDEYYVILRLDREIPLQFTPQVKQQLLDKLFDNWVQKQLVEWISSVEIDRSITEFHYHINSNNLELLISSDLDIESVPIDKISSTSSFFFPQISPAGELLPPDQNHVDTVSSLIIPSSFFLPQESLTKILTHHHRPSANRLDYKILTFVLFFILFFGSGIAAFRYFNLGFPSAVSDSHR